MKKLRKWIHFCGQIKVVYVTEFIPGYYNFGKGGFPKDIFFDTKIECLNSILKVLELKVSEIKHKIKTYDKNER